MIFYFLTSIENTVLLTIELFLSTDNNCSLQGDPVREMIPIIGYSITD